jgi:hypothetical protein
MSWLAKQWERAWFPEIRPERLGWLRVIAGSVQMYLLLNGRRGMHNIARSSPDLFSPVGLATVLDSPLSPAVFDGLLWLSIGLGVCFVLGLWHRVIGPLFAVLVLFVVSYRLSWGMVYRIHHLVGLHVLLLGLVPSAKAISLDAWLARRLAPGSWGRLGAWRNTPPGAHWRYGWPVHLMCVVTTIAYSLAGVAKITGQAGWQWANGNNLRNHVAHDALAKELMTRGGGSEWIDLAFMDERIMIGMAWVSLIVELFAPVFLLNRRLAQAWVLTAVGMHFGIKVLMDLTFPYQCYGFAFASFFAIDMWADSAGAAIKTAWNQTLGGRPSASE